MDESRRQFVAALTAGVTGALAGCGGSDSGTPTEESTPTANEMATETDDGMATETDGDMVTETDSGTATETDDGMGTVTPEPVAQTVAVGADGLRFSPRSFEIDAGDTVLWEWDAGGHNVKPDSIPDGSDWSGTAGSGTFGSGHTYSYTFDVAGDYSYYCAPHRSADMKGSFVVK